MIDIARLRELHDKWTIVGELSTDEYEELKCGIERLFNCYSSACLERDQISLNEMLAQSTVTAADTTISRLEKERDEVIAINEKAAIALSLVSGALVDSGVIVPDDEMEYGDAVREIVKERDAAITRAEKAETAFKDVTEWGLDISNRYMARADNIARECCKERDAALLRATNAEAEVTKLRDVLEQWRDYRFRCADTPGAREKLDELLFAAEDATDKILDGKETP